MKKTLLLLIMIALFSATLQATSIAVIPFTGGDSGEGDTIARLLGTELTKYNRSFRVVPRTAAMSSIMNEQKFQRNGLTDGDTISRIGKMANAEYVVTGHIQRLGNEKLIVISMTEVESFRQTSGIYYTYKDLSEILDKLQNVSVQLIEYTLENTKKTPSTLAVLPFTVDASSGANRTDAEVLAQILACEIVNTGRYSVVVRTSTIEQIMSEQKIQRSGLTDSATVKKIGEAINADLVLAGFVSKVGSVTLMDAQIVEVETSNQITGGDVKYQNIDDGSVLMRELSYIVTGAHRNKEVVFKALASLLQLHQGQKNIDEMNKLLGKGYKKTKDKDLGAALILASEAGHEDIVKELVAVGADVNSKAKGDVTPLIMASRSGHDDIVRILIASGADVNAKDKDNYTVLYYATEADNIEIVKLLLVSRVAINTKVKDDGTALILASSNGYTDIAKELIEAGADVNAQNKEGNTALMSVSNNGNIEIVRSLIKAKANLNSQNKEGDTALILASSSGHSEVVKALTEARANLEISNKKSFNALGLASTDGYTEIVKTLIAAGANVNASQRGSNTALIYACSNGHTEVVKALINAKADINATNNFARMGGTPLYNSACKGHTEIVRALIAAGVDVKGADSLLAITDAALSGHNEIVNLINEARAK